MLNSKNVVIRMVLFLAFVGMCVVCLWIPLVTFNDLPPFEATEIARKHAIAEGHPVQEAGSYGQYATQPDFFGGSEVEVNFSSPQVDQLSVVVRLGRSCSLFSWHVVRIAIRAPLE
jgi:hypothetical protein